MNERFALQVIGAGPAGMSLVLALCNRIAMTCGRQTPEQGLLESLCLIEAAEQPGGKMDSYRVNANTSAHDVVRGIGDGSPFEALRDHYLLHPETQSRLIPLADIGRLMVQPLAAELVAYLGGRLRCGTRVERVSINAGIFESYDAEGQHLASSDQMVLCCGAREVPLGELDAFRDRWEGSGRFLQRENLEGLNQDRQPIVIVGASHSAFSCAWRLLYDPIFKDFSRDRDIVLLQRRERIKLRCTREFAAANRVEYDPVEDVCPQSGLVFRNAGLRKDAKQLYLDLRDGRETRARIQPMDNLAQYHNLLEQSSLILQATGFDSNLPRIERDGHEIQVGQPSDCGELRELDDNRIIPGLFGMGLGLNIVPGHAPGEPSFTGGLHGFQSYPLTIAPGLIDRLTARVAAERVS